MTKNEIFLYFKPNKKSLYLNQNILRMKQGIIFILTVCLWLSANVVSAQKRIPYGQVELVTNYDPVSGNTRYGLYKDGKEIMPTIYEAVVNTDVQLIALFAEQSLYLYDMNGKLIKHKKVDFPFDKDSSVDFEPIKALSDVQCYELTAYFFNSSWGGDHIGMYFRRDGHTYSLDTKPRIEQLN